MAYPRIYVRISAGSGADSGEFGVIVDRRDIRTDGRGVPTNVAGAYKPVDWKKEVPIRVLELSRSGVDAGRLITMPKNRVRRITDEERALLGYLHHVRSTKEKYQPPRSLTNHVETALSSSSGREEQLKALKGIVHHNAAVKAEYKLPDSLMRQIRSALGENSSLGAAASSTIENSRINARVIGDLDDFTQQYIKTALWSSTDNSDDQGGSPLDENFNVEDFAPDALKRMIADCEKFQKEHWGEISGKLGLAGHDFWLTRNGHGAGFWDGDWPEPLGDVLTKASEKFGTQDIYVGDDGKLYVS